MKQNYSGELLVKTFERCHLPFLKQFVSFHSVETILEIGDNNPICSQLRTGGNCEVVHLNINLILFQINKRENYDKELVKFLEENIPLKKKSQLFDLILIDELLIHLGERRKILKCIMEFLNPYGIIFVSFNPWYTPFSGCRKIANSRLLPSIPFIHLLPREFYRFLLKYCFKEESHIIDKLLEIKNNTLSVEKFRRFVMEEEIFIKAECLYFINPILSSRYNFEPVELMEMFKGIPYLRNMFSFYCSYVLTKNIPYVQII